MFELIGGLTVVTHIARPVSYSEVESALNGEAFLSDYHIVRSQTSTGTDLTISVHVPMSAISGDGVPHLAAVQTLRALADALAPLER